MIILYKNEHALERAAASRYVIIEMTSEGAKSLLSLIAMLDTHNSKKSARGIESLTTYPDADILITGLESLPNQFLGSAYAGGVSVEDTLDDEDFLSFPEMPSELDIAEANTSDFHRIPDFYRIEVRDNGIYILSYDEHLYGDMESELIDKEDLKMIADGKLPWR